ncbi:MAG: MYXO-CTERM sorting domain-containing protein, partial [Myxococcota bacterium]|nr:MYXO-CTERM sorting domain-containing protein [Myxococcota bacterium]
DGGACGGACDGVARDACAYPDVTTICRAGSCAAGVAILEAGCGGAGACPAEMTQVCAPFLCGDAGCDGDCATDDDCDAGAFCAAGVCSAQLDDGGVCDRERQCGSGECVDGVCCESACDGQCEACDVAGSEGVCSVVTGAPHGARAACASDGSDCGGACDGTERAACSYPDATASCGDATCAEGMATAAGACDAAGSCDAGGSTECSPFACGDTACLDACTGDEDCAAGFSCVGSECVEVDADGGVVDADGGVGDGGIDPDGGEVPAAPGSGCGCAVPGGSRDASAPALLLGVLGLAWLARRRRSRSLRAR